jgi:hypothetical protein
MINPLEEWFFGRELPAQVGGIHLNNMIPPEVTSS